MTGSGSRSQVRVSSDPRHVGHGSESSDFFFLKWPDLLATPLLKRGKYQVASGSYIGGGGGSKRQESLMHEEKLNNAES